MSFRNYKIESRNKSPISTSVAANVFIYKIDSHVYHLIIIYSAKSIFLHWYRIISKIMFHNCFLFHFYPVYVEDYNIENWEILFDDDVWYKVIILYTCVD